jgi:Bacterial PH domain
MAPRTRTYKILLDWWLLIPISLILLVLVLGIPAVMFSSLPVAQRLIFASILALVTLSVVDAAFFSYYQLSESSLIITSQLRHVEFAYRQLRDIKPAGFRALITTRGRKRFALSRKAFEIGLEGAHWRSVTISPADRDAFITVLMDRVDRERSSRVTTPHKKKA